MKNNTRDENAEKPGEKPGALSRRAFLGKTAAIGVGVSGVAALACGSSDSKNTSPGGSTDKPTFDALNDSKLNPQDTSFTTYTTDYSAIFQPFKIGKLTIRNRLAKSAAGSEFTDMHNGAILSDTITQTASFYGEMAKGGLGVIFISDADIYDDNRMGIWDILLDVYNNAFETLTARVHQYNTPIFGQIAGNITDISSKKTISSPIDSNNVSNMMSEADILTMQTRLVECAKRFKARGFDGVDINASCSHTFSTFLSRFWNTDRTDQYGPQSLENRARIVTELIAMIKADTACGPDFPVEVLYSGIEEDAQNLGSSLTMKLDEAVEFAKLFEKAGADALQIRCATPGNHATGFMFDLMHVPEHGHTGFGTTYDFSKHLDGSMIGKWDGAAGLLDVATEIKKNVSIPVGFVGDADPRLAPDVLNNAIRDGKVDFIYMTRALLADPGIANKLKEGRRDEVAPCAKCLTCFGGGLDFQQRMLCRVNPTLHRAYTTEMPEGPDVAKASTSKKVMVIGGGPAGMEAARIAAQRGHSVTLYDSNSALGGKLPWAAAVKGTHEKIADYIKYLTRQQEVNGVTVVKEKTVTVDDVKSNAPDIVVVAVGGTRPALAIKGIDSSIVVKTTSTPSGTNVAILGLNFQAVDYAIRLVKLGKTVTMISSSSSETEDNLDIEHPCWPRYHNKVWLRAKGVQVYGGAQVTQITDSGLTLTTSYGTTVDLELDAVVPFPSLVKNTKLYDAINALGIVVYQVGDCADPGTIAKGVATANLTMRKA